MSKLSESEYYRGRKDCGKIFNEKSIPKKRLPNEDPKKYNVVKKLENNTNNNDNNDDSKLNINDAMESIYTDNSTNTADDKNINKIISINPWNIGASSKVLLNQDVIDNNSSSIFDSNLTFGAMNSFLSYLVSRNYIENKTYNDNINIDHNNDIINKLKSADNAAIVKRQEILNNKLNQLHKEYAISLEKK